MLDRFIHVLGLVAFLLLVLFGFTFMSCTMSATMTFNMTHEPGSGGFRWYEGSFCTANTLSHYIDWIHKS